MTRMPARLWMTTEVIIRKAHYDWVSTMGKLNIDGKMKWFGFNLTRNKSIDQEKYNENIIWFENETSLLPPVTFTESGNEGLSCEGRSEVRMDCQG